MSMEERVGMLKSHTRQFTEEEIQAKHREESATRIFAAPARLPGYI